MPTRRETVAWQCEYCTFAYPTEEACREHETRYCRRNPDTDEGKARIALCEALAADASEARTARIHADAVRTGSANITAEDLRAGRRPSATPRQETGRNPG